MALCDPLKVLYRRSCGCCRVRTRQRHSAAYVWRHL